MSKSYPSFMEQIQELISLNDWQGLQLEVLEVVDEKINTIRIRLPADHRISPSGIVNDYTEGVNPLEQIQQECLRALRTGHPGI